MVCVSVIGIYRRRLALERVTYGDRTAAGSLSHVRDDATMSLRMAFCRKLERSILERSYESASKYAKTSGTYLTLKKAVVFESWLASAPCSRPKCSEPSLRQSCQQLWCARMSATMSMSK